MITRPSTRPNGLKTIPFTRPNGLKTISFTRPNGLKTIPSTRPNGLKTIPFTRPNGLKTIPSPAAHTRIANMWDYPIPPGNFVTSKYTTNWGQSKSDYLFVTEVNQLLSNIVNTLNPFQAFYNIRNYFPQSL